MCLKLLEESECWNLKYFILLFYQQKEIQAGQLNLNNF